MRAVLTGSMEPDLPVGSLLIIVPTAYEEIEIGADITFIRDEKLTVVTHRVISKDESLKTLTTQGIANNSADKPVHYDNVLGKVSYDIPYIGYIMIVTNTMYGKIIVGVVCLSLLGISLLFGSKDPKDKNKDKKKDNILEATE